MAFKEEDRERFYKSLEKASLEDMGIVNRLLEASLLGKNIGCAYGFFYCNTPERDVKAHLPEARGNASTPGDLELVLREGTIDSEDDPELKELAYQAHQMGNNYTMIAYLPDATNERTARELGDIQNALYQSPLQEKFHKDSGKFWGGIIYKEGKEYQFLE